MRNYRKLNYKGFIMKKGLYNQQIFLNIIINFITRVSLKRNDLISAKSDEDILKSQFKKVFCEEMLL